jgi:hypothetical protein
VSAGAKEVEVGMAVPSLLPAPGAADGQSLLVDRLRVCDVEEGVHLIAWPFD